MSSLALPRVADVASRQHGLFTRSQARHRGIARSTLSRALGRGELADVQPGVYLLAGHPDSWDVRALAASLVGSPRPYPLCLASAAHLHGLLGFDRGVGVEITVPRDRARRPTGPVVHETRRDPIAVMVRAHHVTTVDRTIVDLVRHRVVPASEPALDLVADAVRRRLTTLPRLGRFVEAGRRYPFKAILRELLLALEPDEARWRRTESPIEVIALRALREAGLPMPEVNAVVVDADGVFIARVDWLFRRAKLVVEMDGLRWHATPGQKRVDDHRQNALVMSGHTVLRYTLDDIRSGRMCLQVAATLAHAAASPT